MELREPDGREYARIREVVDSSMTTHYRLSPDEIDAIASEAFADDAASERVADEDSVLRVAEVEDERGEPHVAGVVAGTVDGPVGTLEWLFVDPEHAGQGIGTELFETAETDLAGDAEYVRAGVLETSTDGREFVERFGYERVGDRTLDLAGTSLVEYVYADPDVEPQAVLESTADREAFPGADVRPDGTVTATTDDGERVIVDREDEQSGKEAAFYVAYVDEVHSEPFGYYCSNCGSLETAMDEMERIECSNCGNHHASKSRKTYDESFL